MAEHEVRWKLPTRKGWPVGVKDMHFRVKSDGDLLGVLLVSQGKVAWRPRYGQKGKQLEVSWEDFDGFMREFGKARWQPVDEEPDDD